MRRFRNQASLHRAQFLWAGCRLAFGFTMIGVIAQQISILNSIDLTSPAWGNHDVGGSGRRLHKFVNCSVIPAPSHSYSALTIAGSGDQHPPTKKPCALLFFGLAKQFRSIVLPSIQEQILQVSENGRCDMYLHNYEIETTLNPRAGEYDNKLDPSEVYDLTRNIVMDTAQDFAAKRNMKYYADADRKPYRTLGWDRTSFENMYKQWHSIERVWDMMQDAERRLGIEYDRVGLFRTDVQYMTPIDIFDGDAVIPKFGFLVNDRMFYGTYDNAYIWAKIRYPSVGCYVPRHKSIKMHSEFFMNDLVLKNIPEVIKKDICFYRVRADGTIWDDDCTKKYDFPRHLVDLNLTYS